MLSELSFFSNIADIETVSVRKVRAVELALALKETYLSDAPELSFIRYRPQSPIPKIYITNICCLSEVKTYFDIHLKRMRVCNHHGFGCKQHHTKLKLYD